MFVQNVPEIMLVDAVIVEISFYTHWPGRSL